MKKIKLLIRTILFTSTIAVIVFSCNMSDETTEQDVDLPENVEIVQMGELGDVSITYLEDATKFKFNVTEEMMSHYKIETMIGEDIPKLKSLGICSQYSAPMAGVYDINCEWFDNNAPVKRFDGRMAEILGNHLPPSGMDYTDLVQIRVSATNFSNGNDIEKDDGSDVAINDIFSPDASDPKNFEDGMYCKLDDISTDCGSSTLTYYPTWQGSSEQGPHTFTFWWRKCHMEIDWEFYIVPGYGCGGQMTIEVEGEEVVNVASDDSGTIDYVHIGDEIEVTIIGNCTQQAVGALFSAYEPNGGTVYEYDNALLSWDGQSIIGLITP